jgi:hypothetical protein
MYDDGGRMKMKRSGPGGLNKWTAEQLEWLKGIQTEIGAGKTFGNSEPDERAHNNACDRAVAIVQNYIDGYGLFMMAGAGTLRPSKGMEPAKAFEAGRKILENRKS